MRYYTSNYQPRADAYRRLALEYYDDPYAVVTLNYDLIFEIALQSIGLGCHYFSPSPKLKSVPIAKLHGSINWINHNFPFTHPSAQSDSEAVQSVYSNIFATDNISFLSPSQLDQLTYRDFIRTRHSIDEPAIVPPVAVKEDVDKVTVYEPVWNYAAELLRSASELVVIGCSFHEGDSKFLDLVESNIGHLSKLTVAQPHPEPVYGIIESLVDDTSYDTESYSDFEEYAKTL